MERKFYWVISTLLIVSALIFMGILTFLSVFWHMCESPSLLLYISAGFLLTGYEVSIINLLKDEKEKKKREENMRQTVEYFAKEMKNEIEKKNKGEI